MKGRMGVVKGDNRAGGDGQGGGCMRLLVGVDVLIVIRMLSFLLPNHFG